MIIQQRLDALKELEILDTPSDSTFENLTQITKSLFNVPIVLVSLIDQNRQWFKSHVGLDVCELPLEGAFCPQAIKTDSLFIVEDALLDPYFKNSPLVKEEPYIRFYAGAPIHTENGIAIGTLCIIDTEPRQLEAVDQKRLLLLARQVEQLIYLHYRTKELNIARHLAEQSNQAKTEFLSSMSHELRTPLNAILGFAQLLSNSKQPLAPRQQRQAEQIVRSGNHLLNLINEVLDLARIEAGHTQVSIETIDLREVLEDSIELLTPLIAQQQLQLRINTNTCQSYFVEADYTRLKQILINLLSNAIKYNRPQGSITLHCTIDEQQAHIHIHDTGIGIEADQLEAIFEPFHRSSEQHCNVEGTGVGLALCRKLARLMNIEISVTSTVGEGSCFSLSLPIPTTPRTTPRKQELS